MTIEMVPTLATTASGSTGDSKRRDHGHRRKVGSGESRPSSSLHSISTAQTDYLEDKIEIGHPFYKVPTHPLILPQSVLNHELKPQPTLELWDVDGVNAFVIDVMGALPATYNYHEGIHLCRTMFVKKYGLGNYMDSMALFWSMFHKSYAGRDMDPYSASWIRWRHDRRMELEQILCHYPSKKEECTDFLEEYLEFSQITAIDKEGGRKSNMVFYKTYGEKVSRFEVEFLGVEKCCPDCAIVKEREKDRQELHGRNQSATSIGRWVSYLPIGHRASGKLIHASGLEVTPFHIATCASH